MSMPRIRLLYLVVVELARKYTRSLVLGFLLGLFLSFAFWKTYPFIISLWVQPIDRIGMVGEYNPSTLPLRIQSLISSGLTTLNADGSPMISLADSWEATNSGKTFVFTLSTDKKWHNGKTVTAHDVNYNIRGVTLIPTGENTLIAYLQYPYSPFPTLVSKPLLLPGLMGFGDYEVGRIELRGGSVKMIQLYPVDTNKGTPKRFTMYQTEAQAILAFKLGEIDQLEDLSTASALLNWGNVEITESTNYQRVVTLFFNMKNQELEDKNIRQGLAYAVPPLPYERAVSPISKTSWAYTKNVKNYTYDPETAKKLIADTHLGTSSAQLTLSTFPSYIDVASKIAKSWTDIGIKTRVQIETSVPENYQVLLSGQDIPPDPDQYPFWHSTQQGTNTTGYANVKIDKLLEDGRQELDQEKRALIYTDFQRRLVEDAPAVFLYYPSLYTVKRVK